MTTIGALRRFLGAAALAGTGLIAGTVARELTGGVKVEERADVRAVVSGFRAQGMDVGPEAGVPVLRIFGDYECPACAALEKAAGDTLRSLAHRGRIRFVYHHAPLRGHRRGPDAAAAAYCAADAGAGWQAHRALYESAPGWGTGPDGQDRLMAAVGRAVRDTASLRACMRSQRTRRSVDADRSAADALGVSAVPTVYFEDRRLRIRSWRALVRYVTDRAATP